MPDKAPLAGLRIIGISSFVAAPPGGMTLAQRSADVIRVDPVGGATDTTRRPLAPSGASLYWTSLNKGKRPVTLDFRSAEGRPTVAGLVAKSGPDGETMRGRSAMPSRGLVGDSSHSRSLPGRLASTAPVSVTSVSRSQMRPLPSRSCGSPQAPRVGAVRQRDHRAGHRLVGSALRAMSGWSVTHRARSM